MTIIGVPTFYELTDSGFRVNIGIRDQASLADPRFIAKGGITDWVMSISRSELAGATSNVQVRNLVQTAWNQIWNGEPKLDALIGTNFTA